MHWTKFILLLVICVILANGTVLSVGCWPAPGPLPAPQLQPLTDEWIAIPAQFDDILKAENLLDRTSIYPIDANRIDDASRLLEAVSVQEITEAQFTHFTGQRPPVLAAPNKLYLTRCVTVDRTRGRVDVYRKGDTIYVRYGCLAANPGRIIRFPIILALPEQPLHVYVDAEIVR